MRIEQLAFDQQWVDEYLQQQQNLLEGEFRLPTVPPRSLNVESYCTGGFDCQCLSCSAWNVACKQGAS